MQEITNRIEQGRKVIEYLNSIWWNKSISRRVKRYVEKFMMESVLCQYGVNYKCGNEKEI